MPCALGTWRFTFLKNPQKIEPFKIDKKGFGNMAAWITLDDLGKLKVTGG